jgi:nicotinamide-nucleotide amidase
MKCAILTIGDEILIGQIVDTNSAWLAGRLNELGIDVVEMRSVGDELQAMISAIEMCQQKAELVIITGGLGPTKDDITKTAICRYYAVGMTFSESTKEHIRTIYERFGKTFTKAHEDQCYMPSNARLLHNSMGTAPGMWIEDDKGIVVSVPGVPYEMKAIFEQEMLPELIKRKGNFHILHSTIMTAGEGETFIADRIEPLLADMPDYIKLAYLPSLGAVRLRLTGRSTEELQLRKDIDHYTHVIQEALGTLAYGTNDESLEQHLLNVFTKKGLRLGTAESCTGGYLSHRITGVAGSSDYFQGGYVSYSNDCKQQWLEVKAETLQQYGAVSQQVVEEMVQGLLNRMHIDVGVAISGIAGPGGGTAEKPVGTIWIAVGNREVIETRLIKASKDRLKNIEYAAVVAMNLIRRFVIRHYN